MADASTAREGVTYSLHDPATQQFFASRGFGGSVSFGQRPALLVIDMAPAWLDEASPLGSDQEDVVVAVCELLSVARTSGTPIFFTTTAYDAETIERGAVLNEKSPGRALLSRGSRWVQLEPRLGRRPDEVLIEKQRGSAFVGTTLTSQLIARQIDTLVIAGVSTSGCVRSTANDAHDLNLRVHIAREAVGDRHPVAHEFNLVDINRLYADVRDLTAVCADLKNASSLARG